MNIKNKIQEKSGVGMIGLIVSLTIFSAILVGFTTWYINLNNNVAITGERMEEMSIAYDRWNQIINEDFDSLKERVDKISGRTESKLISNKYDLTIAYGSEGKFINGECVGGQAADDEQRCIPVSISVKNRNAIAGVASKPYSLSTTRVASQGSGGGGGFALDYSKKTSVDCSNFDYAYGKMIYNNYYIAPKNGLFKAFLGFSENHNDGHGESHEIGYPTSILVNNSIAETGFGEKFAFVKKGDIIQAGSRTNSCVFIPVKS